MSAARVHLRLPDADATAALGGALAQPLGVGDALCLAGGLGAGKSALARALIQARLAAEDAAEDAPSPTYTLVQVYDTDAGPIWHVDLYRLGGAEEIEELGLLEAMADALLVVEWPDRMGELLPARRIDIALEIPQNEAGRHALIAFRGAGWGAAREAVGGLGLERIAQ